MNSDNGWESSAQAWIDDMDSGADSREHLLDALMLELCAARPSMRALDVGCGEGRFCRMLRQRGVAATGIDPTAKLLDAARDRDPEGDYQLARAEQLPFTDGTFDLVVSYLTLIDIDDFRTAVNEMARVLRPGGKIIVANLTSMATASTQGWWRDEQGNKMFWPLDGYMSERREWVEWRGIRVLNWHRPLSAYMRAFLAANLLLEHFDEVVPSAEQIALAPGLSDHWRKPDFMTMRWTKLPS